MNRTAFAGLALALGVITVGAACGNDETSLTGGAGPSGGSGGTGGTGATGGAGGTGAAGGAGGTGAAGGAGGDGGAGGAGGGSPLCFLGGNAVTPSGNGTCASPYVVDMSALAAGSVVFHDAGTLGADETTVFGFGGCSQNTLFTGTARDLIYQVLVPPGTNLLDVSVDAQAGADPRVGLFEDVTCGQPINDCADDGAVGQCDALRGDSMAGEWFGVGPYVIVSELVDSGQPLTVRFRIDGP